MKNEELMNQKMTNRELDYVAGGNGDECNEIAAWIFISDHDRSNFHKSRPRHTSDGFAHFFENWVMQSYVEKAIAAETGSKDVTARCHTGKFKNTYTYVDGNGNSVSLTHRQAMKMVKKFYPCK